MIDKIISKLHNLNISPKNIVTYSLCLNAFGLLSLIYGEFLLFIMLFAFSLYLNKVYKEYIKKYDVKDRYMDIYFNFADYVKILSTYAIFTALYKKKINNNIIFISIVLLVLCNINFTVENILESENKEEHEIENTYNKIFMKYWNKTLSWISIDKLKIIHIFTKYFSEIMILSYFIILMLYIHYK